ncbi:hypothetical protein, partial [Paucihalobacter sp.]|uniref:hypothetical protein n=1 Tax=Paucihalobacter sp. TaxID=2850405 RepID=UPI003D1614B6
MQLKFLYLLSLVFLSSCQTQESIQTNAIIIPQPHIQQISDDHFVLISSPRIIYDERLKESALFLIEFLEQGANFR